MPIIRHAQLTKKTRKGAILTASLRIRASRNTDQLNHTPHVLVAGEGRPPPQRTPCRAPPGASAATPNKERKRCGREATCSRHAIKYAR